VPVSRAAGRGTTPVTGPALVEAVGCMTGVCMTEVAVGTEGEGDGVPLGEAF